MTQFLQSHVVLVAGSVLLLVILGVRALTRDRDLRLDLRFAFFLIVAFLALRLTSIFFEDGMSKAWANLLTLAWMLTFAFGVIRFIVGAATWALRVYRGTPTPKILRDVTSALLYALASLPILKSTMHVDLAGLLATSAVLSVVLGFALQETLGNLFAGLSLQLERPFEVGDVVSIDTHLGRIAQIGWRATRIETYRNESITLPNNVISRAAVKNFSRGGTPVGTDITLGVAYEVPPNKVKGAVLDTLREIPDCLQDPPPLCRTLAFEDNSIKYLIRFFTRSYDFTAPVAEQLHTRLWYRFQKDKIEVPFPQRVVHLRKDVPSQQMASDELLGLLTSVDIFQLLRPDDLRALANELLPRRFGTGERVITQGDPGNTFYVVAEGLVSVRAGSPEHELVQLGRGQYFGEMSLLTGDARTATVVAIEETVLLEVNRPTFARVLSAHPDLAKALSELLARRRTELLAAKAVGGAVEAAPEAKRIFSRLREIFGLAEG